MSDTHVRILVRSVTFVLITKYANVGAFGVNFGIDIAWDHEIFCMIYRLCVFVHRSSYSQIRQDPFYRLESIANCGAGVIFVPLAHAHVWFRSGWPIVDAEISIPASTQFIIHLCLIRAEEGGALNSFSNEYSNQAGVHGLNWRVEGFL